MKLFCKHIFEKTGTERDGGFLHKDGKITGGQCFIRCTCNKCNKIIWVRDSQDNKNEIKK